EPSPMSQCCKPRCRAFRAKILPPWSDPSSETLCWENSLMRIGPSLNPKTGREQDGNRTAKLLKPLLSALGLVPTGPGWASHEAGAPRPNLYRRKSRKPVRNCRQLERASPWRQVRRKYAKSTPQDSGHRPLLPPKGPDSPEPHALVQTSAAAVPILTAC